jgi:hypothetical protein
LQKNALEILNKIINNYSERIELKEKKNLNNSFDLSLMNKNTSNSCNNSKINIFSLTKEIRSSKIKNNNNIKKKNNIFKNDGYDNIIILKSKNKINDDENSNK